MFSRTYLRVAVLAFFLQLNPLRFVLSPKRYHYQLTEQGKALWPVLKEMIQWSNTFIPGLYAEDEIKQIAKERFSTSQLSE